MLNEFVRGDLVRCPNLPSHPNLWRGKLGIVLKSEQHEMWGPIAVIVVVGSSKTFSFNAENLVLISSNKC